MSVSILFNKENLISAKAMKSELGYTTERFKLNSEDECNDWINDSNNNSIVFCHGDLAAEDVWYTTIKGQTRLLNNDDVLSPDGFGGSDF